MEKSTEFVKFSLIQTPCCGQLLCWVNPRLPNYCPECGKPIWIKIKHPEAVLHTDNDARLIIHGDFHFLRGKQFVGEKNA